MEINIVTGGNGFVGKYLVKRLLESGKNVWVIIRPSQNLSAPERGVEIFGDYLENFPNTLRIIEGDITIENLGIDKSCLQELYKRDVIFWHLAANLSFAIKDKDLVTKTNLNGTINSVNLANKIAKKYIHLSTAYVCGNTTKMFREEDLEVGQKFRNYYESSKFEAEKYVRSDCVVPYLVFRPSIIMGDAYEGKAEGCTFGYYRFAYIFFIFKNWLIDRMANGSSITKKILSMSGTSYDMKSDLITIPWLVIPYTTHGTVDMVSIDYVLDSMLKGVDNINVQKLTIHLTNPNPPAFKWAASCLVQDLGYRKVKYFKVAPVFLVILLKTLYHVFYPLKIKTRSAMWYLPYITRNYFFSHKNSKAFEIPEQKLIGRDFLEKINTYAKKEIFKKIVYDK